MKTMLKTSIHQSLIDSTRKKLLEEERLANNALDEVKEILAMDEAKEKAIFKMFGSAALLERNKTISESRGKLKNDDVVHYDRIKKICLRYNLRFTELKNYKGDVPRNIISQMRKDKEQECIDKNYNVVHTMIQIGVKISK